MWFANSIAIVSLLYGTEASWGTRDIASSLMLLTEFKNLTSVYCKKKVSKREIQISGILFIKAVALTVFLESWRLSAHEGNKLAFKTAESGRQTATQAQDSGRAPDGLKHVYFPITHSISQTLRGSLCYFYSTLIFWDFIPLCYYSSGDITRTTRWVLTPTVYPIPTTHCGPSMTHSECKTNPSNFT